MSAYELRATLFLDLLGFRNLIRNGREDDILAALRVAEVNEFPFSQITRGELDFQVTTFSDCIVCSVRIEHKSNFSPATLVMAYGATVAMEMLARGILIRGALTVGKLYHSGKTVFGPALIDAYEMESQFAQYPRILVAKKVGGRINMALAIVRTADWFVANQPFRRDFDGMWHFDIFGPFFMLYRPDSFRLKAARTLKELGPKTRQQVRKLTRKAYKDPRIATKYHWLETYYKDCASRFGWPRL